MAYATRTRKQQIEAIERGQAKWRWFSTTGLVMFGIFAVPALFEMKPAQWLHSGFLLTTLSFLLATVTQWRWHYKYKNRM